MRIPILFLIIITLFLGGAYFYQLRFTKTNPQSPPKQSIKDVVARNRDLENKNPVTATTRGENNFASLLERIPFLPNFLQPTLFLDDTDGQTTPPPAPTGKLNERELALQTEIRNYLIASSDIGFSESARGLRKALENARGGDTLALAEIRDEFKQKLGELRTLPHPQQTNDIHDKSVVLLERYIRLMDDTIHQTRGSVEQTWDSDDLKRIINDAAAVKKDIIQLVTDYRIVLPPGIVL